MSRSPTAAACTFILLLVLSSPALAQQRKPIVAGNLTLNPHHIVAVYRPEEGRALAILVGRPGQNLQTITIKDYREATTVFDAILRNDSVTKNPGDEDARPLTRMVPKDAVGRTPPLIVNVERVSAVLYDPSRRTAQVYLDRLDPFSPLIDPNTDTERDHLAFDTWGELVATAYRECVLAESRR